MFLSRYPEYGKAPQAYVAGLIEHIANYGDKEQVAIADPITGICAHCKYLPTIADIVEFVRERREKINREPY